MRSIITFGSNLIGRTGSAASSKEEILHLIILSSQKSFLTIRTSLISITVLMYSSQVTFTENI